MSELHSNDQPRRSRTRTSCSTRRRAQTGQAIQQNQLAIQGQQMDLTAADHEQVGRLAAGLLNDPDPAARAQAYAHGVGMLQSQGLAKYAPPTLPDEAVAAVAGQPERAGARTSTRWASSTPPGLTDALDAATAPAASQSGARGERGACWCGGWRLRGTQLAQSESGGKTSVINPQGYTGTYQFGKQRLADLGYYTPAPGEDMKNNTTWAGKVSVPGFNVTDQQSFAANPAAQQAVFNTHLGNIDQAIAATPGASRFDPNGLRAVAHLGGIDGMQKFVASGRRIQPSGRERHVAGGVLQQVQRRGTGGHARPQQRPPDAGGAPGAPQVALHAATSGATGRPRRLRSLQRATAAPAQPASQRPPQRPAATAQPAAIDRPPG